MKPIPGEIKHNPPSAEEQTRLLRFSPYVREAQEIMRPAWHLKPRRLFDFLLVHFLDGEGDFTVAGNRFPVQGGDLIWIPPNTLHEMQGFAPGTLLQFIHFDLYYDPYRSHWSARIPGDTTDLSPWSKKLHPVVDDPIISRWCGKIKGESRIAVTETLRRIILEYNRTQTSGLLIAGLVNELLGHLLEQERSACTLTARHAQTIEHAMRQIHLHSHEKLNIEQLARQHGLSPTHFRKLFREQYRQSPRTAHLNAKIRTACDCLIYSSLNVSEIADRLGFTNVHNFSRAFRNATGQSPNAWRTGKTPL